MRLYQTKKFLLRHGDRLVKCLQFEEEKVVSDGTTRKTLDAKLSGLVTIDDMGFFHTIQLTSYRV